MDPEDGVHRLREGVRLSTAVVLSQDTTVVQGRRERHRANCYAFLFCFFLKLNICYKDKS